MVQNIICFASKVGILQLLKFLAVIIWPTFSGQSHQEGSSGAPWLEAQSKLILQTQDQ